MRHGAAATTYEVVQSDGPITAANFAAAEPIAAPAPAPAGHAQAVPLPADPQRFVAIRAVDEQGNVGPAAGHPRAKAERAAHGA